MPAYDYECKDCKIVWEEFHSMNELPIILCKKCGKPASRVYKLGGIQFNSPGFYSSDNNKH